MRNQEISAKNKHRVLYCPSITGLAYQRMEEGIKQDGQKTVVAFVAGLLIGGLLVWAFSGSPENADVENITGDTNTEEDTSSPLEDADEDEVMDDDDNEDVATETRPVDAPPVSIGDGTLAVANQSAGEVVTLGALEYPSTDGWIVVHEYTDGVLGNALGAARYSTGEGLLPEEVRLLRVTEAGNDYFVVFYSDNGDKVFDLGDDYPVMNAADALVGDTMTAQ